MYANKLSYCGKFVVKQLEEKREPKKKKVKKWHNQKREKMLKTKKGECERRRNR